MHAVAETEAKVDPRLVALGFATEIVIEFPAGTVEIDALEGTTDEVRHPVVPERVPLPETASLAPEPVAEPPIVELPLVELPIAAEPIVELAVEAPAPAVIAEPMVVKPVTVKPVVAKPVVAEPVVIRLEPAAVVEALPPSAVLLRTSVVHGLWPRHSELSLEELGLRVGGSDAIAMRWSDVTAIEVRGGRVELRTKAASLKLGMTVDGVETPELSEVFSHVLADAREGTFDPQGSSVHELQNAMDAVRDTFHSSDDAFIPLALGGALSVLTVILAVAVPEILSFLTRPAVPLNTFVLGSRLAPFDPRVLAVAFFAAALVTSLTARAALGPHATSWARGTLRGWHMARPSIVGPLRRGLALVFLHPAVAGTALAVALALAIPSARSHAIVGAAGIHVVRPIPLYDRTATWKEVQEIVVLAASGADHPHGVAALIRFNDLGTVTTQDLPVHNSTDRYFLELTRKWHAQAAEKGR